MNANTAKRSTHRNGHVRVKDRQDVTSAPARSTRASLSPLALARRRCLGRSHAIALPRSSLLARRRARAVLPDGGRGVGLAYTPKSSTRNRIFSTNCTRNAVSYVLSLQPPHLLWSLASRDPEGGEERTSAVSHISSVSEPLLVLV
eukprot:901355-Rhodomonas_salina.1